MTKAVYSLDGESFQYESLEEALAAVEPDELIAGIMFEVGAPASHKASEFFDVDDVLSALNTRACDEGGEYAEDFPDLPKAKSYELEQLISDWLDKNVKVLFWTVSNPRPFEVTQSMIDAFKAGKKQL